MEGLNQKIKTMRRHAYGIADDEYLFLKIMDLFNAKLREQFLPVGLV